MSDEIPMSDEERKWIEIGTVGLNANMGYVQEAYHTELHWPGVQPLYSRMRRSDPEITVVRNVYQALARSIKLQFVLGDDPTDDEKKAQEFGNQVLDDMEGGADGFLSTLVSHVPFMGFGWWEVVLGMRQKNWTPPNDDTWRSEYDDGYIGIRRLAWRDHSSFYKWDMDDKTGKLKGMVQQDSPNPMITIPLERSLHIAFGDTHNPEGLSPLEAVWRLERIKYGLEIVQGIGFEHSAGYLNVIVDGTPSPQDKADIRKAAKAVTTAQEGNYAIWPKGVLAELKDVPFAAASSILEAIKYFGVLKLMVYNMQWAALSATTGVGSNAAMTDSSQMFITVFNAMMEGMISQADDQLGRRLFTLNADHFPGMVKRPRLSCTPIEKQVSLTELASFLGAINWMDLTEEDIKAIRRKSGILPESTPASEDVVRPGAGVQTVTQPAKQNMPSTMQEWARNKQATIHDDLAAEIRRASDLMESKK